VAVGMDLKLFWIANSVAGEHSTETMQVHTMLCTFGNGVLRLNRFSDAG